MALNSARGANAWTIIGGLGSLGGAQAIGNPLLNGLVGLVFVLWGVILLSSAWPAAKAKVGREASSDAVAVPAPSPVSGVSAEQKENRPAPTVAAATLLGPEDPAGLKALGFDLTTYATFNRWAKVAPGEGQSFEELQLVIARDGERVAYASVFDIHNECAWRSKSPKRFVFENDAACDLSALLSREKYQERLRPATDLIFVGMESFPDSPIPTECHGTLSRCRYLELAKASHHARPDNWEGRRYWGIDLGNATLDDPKLEFDQRRAIVVGVKERVTTISLDVLLRDIVMSTTIKGVDLANYSNSGTAMPIPLTLAPAGSAEQH